MVGSNALFVGASKGGVGMVGRFIDAMNQGRALPGPDRVLAVARHAVLFERDLPLLRCLREPGYPHIDLRIVVGRRLFLGQENDDEGKRAKQPDTEWPFPRLGGSLFG